MDQPRDEASDDLTWQFGGHELRFDRSDSLPTTRNGWVMMLADLLTCSLDEAAEIYDRFFADEEFVRSVLTDIDRLADGEIL